MTRKIHVAARHHNLKLFTKYFDHVAKGLKKSEVRYNDRNYQIGDTITLHEGEYEDGRFIYSGRKVSAEISYIDNFGTQDGYVSLSLDKVGLLIV